MSVEEFVIHTSAVEIKGESLRSVIDAIEDLGVAQERILAVDRCNEKGPELDVAIGLIRVAADMLQSFIEKSNENEDTQTGGGERQTFLSREQYEAYIRGIRERVGEAGRLISQIRDCTREELPPQAINDDSKTRAIESGLHRVKNIVDQCNEGSGNK